MHFSDVYCDRRLPDAARTDKARGLVETLA